MESPHEACQHCDWEGLGLEEILTCSHYNSRSIVDAEGRKQEVMPPCWESPKLDQGGGRTKERKHPSPSHPKAGRTKHSQSYRAQSKEV